MLIVTRLNPALNPSGTRSFSQEEGDMSLAAVQVDGKVLAKAVEPLLVLLAIESVNEVGEELRSSTSLRC